jgi:hypothetical protein
MNDSFNCRGHIECIMPKLSMACYIMNTRSYMSLNALKTVYFSYFNMIIRYGLIFWGNLPQSLKVFRRKKKIIRIMMGCKSRTSCRNLFRKLNILLLASQCFLTHAVHGQKQGSLFFPILKIISQVHDNQVTFISPQQTFRFTKKECMGIRVFNNLPHILKIYRIIHGNLKSV